MKNITIGIILIGLIAGAYFFIFKGKQEITNFLPKSGPIVAFGDSLIQGVGASSGADLPSVLAQRIGEPIINMGVSGETTFDALARIDEVLKLEPKIVLVLFGGNDFLKKVPKQETFANINQIVTKLQDSGAIVILLGIRGGVISDGYEGDFKEIAKARNALYVSNVLDGLYGKKEFMSDAVHPNNSGYAYIADRIYPVLNAALGK